MKFNIPSGTTSKITRIFIRDTSQPTEQGLTGLVYNTASLVWYYSRVGDATATAITLVAGVIGTYTQYGFVEIDSVKLPGIYEIGIPNAALAGGDVHMMLFGALNMGLVKIEIITSSAPSTSPAGTAIAVQTDVAGAVTSLAGDVTAAISTLAGDVTASQSALATDITNSQTALAGDITSAVGGVPTAVAASILMTPANLLGTNSDNSVNVTIPSAQLTDIATSVWASGARTLTAFGFTVSANLTQIMGTVLTGTAAYIAAAFSYFFNVSTPIGTINSSGSSLTAAAIMNELFTNGTAFKLNVNSDGTVNLTPSPTITVNPPFNSVGTKLTLVQGNDYSAGNGNSLTFNIVNQPNLIGTVAHLRFSGQTMDACVSPTIVYATQLITMGDMLAAYTSTLPVYTTLRYQLNFVTLGGLTTTVINGTATIIESI